MVLLQHGDQQKQQQQRGRWQPQRPQHTVGPNFKNPPKFRLKRIVKMIGLTYACNSLTDFKDEANEMTGNGNYC